MVEIVVNFLVQVAVRQMDPEDEMLSLSAAPCLSAELQKY